MTPRLLTLSALGAQASDACEHLARRGVTVEALSGPTPEHAIEGIHEAVANGSADLGLVTRLLPGSDMDAVAVLRRQRPHDVVIVYADGESTLARFPAGAHVAVSGGRRLGLLRAHRPDLQPVPLTNGDTPSVVLESGAADALILGAEESRRLGLAERVTEMLDPKAWLPAPEQGAVLIVARTGDTKAQAAVTLLDDRLSHRAWSCERALADSLGAGPEAPIGGLAVPFGRWIRLWGAVTSEDGSRMVRADLTGSVDDPSGLGAAVAELLLERGAEVIFAEGQA